MIREYCCHQFINATIFILEIQKHILPRTHSQLAVSKLTILFIAIMYPFLGHPFNPTTSLSIILGCVQAQECRFTAALEYQYVYICLFACEPCYGENRVIYTKEWEENVCLRIQTQRKKHIYVRNHWDTDDSIIFYCVF